MINPSWKSVDRTRGKVWLCLPLNRATTPRMTINANVNTNIEDLDKDLGHDFLDLFLTEDILSYSSRPVTESDLYHERLQSLFEGQVKEIEAFAMREGRDMDEVRYDSHSLILDMSRGSTTSGPKDARNPACALSL